MADATPSWFFVLVVVRLGRRFLLVHERKHGQGWYLPAGRVEHRESLVEAARRETLEESGVRVTLEGIVRVEHSPLPQATRVRVVFVARPSDDGPPKSTPDDHSLEARWVTLEELDQLPLRGDEVKTLLSSVANGAPVYPLTLLLEGA